MPFLTALSFGAMTPGLMYPLQGPRWEVQGGHTIPSPPRFTHRGHSQAMNLTLSHINVST